MNDTQIIELFFARAESAIAALAEKYGKLCYRIAHNILHSHGDAEECENDTYLRVWNTVPPTWPQQLRAYVSRIARNLALDRAKYLSRQRRSLPVDLLLSELNECIPSPARTECDADDTVIQAITDFLQTLDKQTRVLFIRRYFYGESVDALSKQFGINASSVSTKLTRTRARLKHHLEQEGITI